MPYPDLVHYDTVKEYREHYERVYCQVPIRTFDGIGIRFRKSEFAHIFYESSQRDGRKDAFSRLRAERIDWIAATLQDPQAELYVGWDNKRKARDTKRRVAIVQGNYVVIVQLYDDNHGNLVGIFITAFVADTPYTLRQVKRNPRWSPK